MQYWPTDVLPPEKQKIKGHLSIAQQGEGNYRTPVSVWWGLLALKLPVQSLTQCSWP